MKRLSVIAPKEQHIGQTKMNRLPQAVEDYNTKRLRKEIGLERPHSFA